MVEKVSDSVLLEASRSPRSPGALRGDLPPATPPLRVTDSRPGSVPGSAGPSNIYSSHKLLPTASLTDVGTPVK